MAGVQINQEVLKKKVQSLKRNSELYPSAPTSPGVNSDELKQLSRSLKRTPPPQVPLNDSTAASFPKLRSTGILKTLLAENGEKPKPATKPKPTINKEPSIETPEKKTKPPPPPRNESLNKDEEDASRIRTRLSSGADLHPHVITDDLHKRHEISVDIDSAEEQRSSKQLRPLPTLLSLGDPPEKSPITPLVRSEAKKYISAILANKTTVSVPPEINNNMIDTNKGEDQMEILNHTEEQFGEDMYDDVEAVIKESGIDRDEQLQSSEPSPDGELYEDLPGDSIVDEEDFYEDLPAETGNSQPPVAPMSPPITPQPHPKEQVKTKKDLEKEKIRMKEIEAQRKKEEKERKEREKEQKKREEERRSREEEIMKKAKIKKEDLNNPMRACIAKCTAKAAKKFDLEITEGEKLLVIKEENGKCLVKNSKERLGYVKMANIEDEVEEDSYECIESLKQKLGR